MNVAGAKLLFDSPKELFYCRPENDKIESVGLDLEWVVQGCLLGAYKKCGEAAGEKVPPPTKAGRTSWTRSLSSRPMWVSLSSL